MELLVLVSDSIRHVNVIVVSCEVRSKREIRWAASEIKGLSAKSAEPDVERGRSNCSTITAPLLPVIN